MKYLLILFLPLFFSCEKSGSYKQGEPVDDTKPDFRLLYTSAGTLPTATNTGNGLASTTWVLTRVTVNFVTTFPNDTLRFLTNNSYKLNSLPERPYQFTSGVSSTNKTLTLYFFTPFNGSHWSGQIPSTYLIDGVINNAEFNNIQNITSRVTAYFKKI